jgi:polysaccharide export outer membrane protein
MGNYLVLLRREARRITIALAILIGLVAGPALAQGVGDDGFYRVRAGDVLVVNVLEDPELDAQVLVLPDGRISLPVAGTIRAAGRTPGQVERIVRSRLAGNFVSPPTVTVTLTSLAEDDEDEDEEQFSVYVLGEVTRPGLYEIDPEEPVTVLEALSLAGGVGPFAARGRIQVRERIDGVETLRLFDYEAMEDGIINTDRDLDVLSDNTVIVVPERGLFE